MSERPRGAQLPAGAKPRQREVSGQAALLGLAPLAWEQGLDVFTLKSPISQTRLIPNLSCQRMGEV